MNDDRTYTSFVGDERIVTGDLPTMLAATRRKLDDRPSQPLVILDDLTGKPVDFDFRGSVEELLAREVPPPSAGGPGRPRLGVVAREVTLLPRHWDWLADQRGGASGTLRRLVDDAQRHEGAAARARRSAAVTGRAMTVLAGDLPQFEEAYRALDAGDRPRFEELTAGWPGDVRAYLTGLAAGALRP